MNDNTLEIALIIILAVEQVLPHLPIKANSTVQAVLNIAKLILRRK
jgi:uncharacterized protein YjeT (DUF2065 family)